MALFGRKGGGSLLPRREDVIGPLETALDRVVDDFFGNDFLEGFKGARLPRLNAFTREGHWIVEAGVPGIRKEDLDIEIQDGVLTLAGKMVTDDEQEDGEYFVREISKKAFRRQIRLPDTLEGDPDAVLRDGLLTLKWKLKAEVLERATAKKIEVKTASGSPSEPSDS